MADPFIAPPIDFGSSVASPVVAFASHREKLTGGRWVTIETEDGGYRRLYIKGGKGGHGGKVIAGAGATPSHPKTLGEVISGHREAGDDKPAGLSHPGPLAKSLAAKESEIRDLPHERVYILDHKGEVVHRQEGGQGSVDLDPAGLTGKAKGNVLTHNHPSKDRPLSADDVRLGNRLEMAEMRATTRDGGTFALRYNDRYVPDAEHRKAFREEFDRVSREVDAGKLKADGPYKGFDPDRPTHHEELATIRLAERHGWTYERKGPQGHHVAGADPATTLGEVVHPGRGGQKTEAHAQNAEHVFGEVRDAKVTIHPSASSTEDDVMVGIHAAFGRRVTPEQVAGVAGAPDGSDVGITYKPVAGGRSHVIMVEVKDDRMTAKRMIRREGDGPIEVHNLGFEVDHEHQGKGLGTEVFGRQIEHASRLGVDRIECNAGRSQGFNGYYTWPRFGYDGPIPKPVAEKLPESFRSAKNLSDLMKTGEGRSWWKKNGSSVDVTFDLKAGSLSRKVWDGYRAEKAKGGAGKVGMAAFAIEVGSPKGIEQPDFTEADLAIVDRVWDRLGKAKFGVSSVITLPVAFAAKGGSRSKLSGGHWVTIETEDGGYRHLYITGGKGGYGGKVIAGAGATPGHPKTLAEVATGGHTAGDQAKSVKAGEVKGAPPKSASQESPHHAGDLRRQLQAAPHQEARLKAAGEFVRQAQSAKPTAIQAHGMTEAEHLHSLEFEGVTYHFPPVKPGSEWMHPAVKTLAEHAAHPQLPEALTKHTHTVIFSEQANKHDARRAEEYGIKGFTSDATAGDGRIVQYHGKGLSLDVKAHEMGHNLATGVYGSTTPPVKSGFFEAARTRSGESPPTEYAKTKLAEDFAESVKLYITKPDHLRSIAPKRHAAIKALLESGS